LGEDAEHRVCFPFHGGRNRTLDIVPRFDHGKYFCLNTKGDGGFFNLAKLRDPDGIGGMCKNGDTPRGGDSLLQYRKTLSRDLPRSV
jgi:hypothetical protein